MPASTVTEYLAALPADRRDALNEVRRGINRALPPGYKEGIQFGMISWFVPLSTYPAGYGGNPKEPRHSLSNRSVDQLVILCKVWTCCCSALIPAEKRPKPRVDAK